MALSTVKVDWSPHPGNGVIGYDKDSSKNGHLVDYEALLRLFECPICHDWVSPPIAQCQSGHIACGPCRKRGLKSCINCQQRFSKVPNWMMWQIAATIAFPCRFQGHGCRHYCYTAVKKSHEALCPHRPISCQYSVKGCPQILQFRLMEDHVTQCPFKPRLL